MGKKEMEKLFLLHMIDYARWHDNSCVDRVGAVDVIMNQERQWYYALGVSRCIGASDLVDQIYEKWDQLSPAEFYDYMRDIAEKEGVSTYED